ncbi:MAG: hypothetical protein WDN69_09605 [Aliidongia sp.]
MKFEGRPIRLAHAGSAEAGKKLLAATPDIACVLLDVVMESEHAGLDLARQIRDELGNHAIRIVLRTGQPGYAPPLEVIQRYDINDYKEKTELTQTPALDLGRLRIALLSADPPARTEPQGFARRRRRLGPADAPARSGRFLSRRPGRAFGTAR